jgi:hypothetical protein
MNFLLSELFSDLFFFLNNFPNDVTFVYYYQYVFYFLTE